MKYALTLEKLKSVPEGHLPNVMWQYYLDYSSHAERQGHWTPAKSREFDLSLPRGLRLVHSWTRFDGDILNGGITQYICNHTYEGRGEEVIEDLEALKTIGADESAAILEQAISVFSRYGWPGEPTEPVPDFGRLDEIEELDRQRCNNESSRRDYKLLERYLREHLDECVCDGGA